MEACGNAALVEPRAASCDADGVRALINVIKKEEITESVDIASKVQARARLALPFTFVLCTLCLQGHGHG